MGRFQRQPDPCFAAAQRVLRFAPFGQLSLDIGKEAIVVDRHRRPPGDLVGKVQIVAVIAIGHHGLQRQRAEDPTPGAERDDHLRSRAWPAPRPSRFRLVGRPARRSARKMVDQRRLAGADRLRDQCRSVDGGRSRVGRAVGTLRRLLFGGERHDASHLPIRLDQVEQAPVGEERDHQAGDVVDRRFGVERNDQTGAYSGEQGVALLGVSRPRQEARVVDRQRATIRQLLQESLVRLIVRTSRVLAREPHRADHPAAGAQRHDQQTGHTEAVEVGPVVRLH